MRPDASDGKPFLDSRSIQEHVCQILEGGRKRMSKEVFVPVIMKVEPSELSPNAQMPLPR